MDSHEDERLLDPGSVDVGYSINAPRHGKASRLPQLFASSAACLAGVAGGLSLGFSSPIVPELLDEGVLTIDQASWFASMPTLGAILGGLIAGFMIERCGRKFTVMMCGPFAVIGWLLIATSTDFPVMVTGRALTGIALGMSSLCVPVYVAEVASKDLRGGLGAMYQTSMTSGIFLSYCLGLALKRQWLAIVSSTIPAISVILMVMVPESPRWLIKCREDSAAASALLWLRGPSYNIDREHQDITSSLSSQNDEFTWKDITKPYFLKTFAVCIVIMVTQQMIGVNALGTYAQYIFEQAGFRAFGSQAAVALGVVGVLSTTISCLVQDKAGRRVLLVISGLFCGLTMALLGAYFYLVKDLNQIQRSSSMLRWLSITSAMVYVAFFSLTWGPTVWLLVAELLPSRGKGLVASTSTAINWAVGFLVSKEFLDLQNVLGEYGPFWLFSAFAIFGVIFILMVVPETRGRTLEEIEQHFIGNHV